MPGMIDMVPGPDGVFRMKEPGTALARVANPSTVSTARATAGAGGRAAASGLGGFLRSAVSWVARLSTPGKILLAGAAIIGVSKLANRDAPQAAHLAGAYPTMPYV
ncbi:MAG: hypothetical protein RMA76_10710 [Deltaproteobacteria bacterium]